MSGRPILVTGAIRSGTTWVGRCLAAAPGVALIHEPFNLDHPQGVFAHRWPYQYAYVRANTPEAEEVGRPLSDTFAFRYRGLLHLLEHEGARRTLGMARDLPLFLIRRFLTRPRAVVKDPIAIFAAGWLAERFDMDVVITVRHPAAFTWSYLRIGEPNRLGDLLAQPALIEGPLAPLADDVRAAAGSDDPVVAATTLWKAVHHVIADYRSNHPGWLVRRHEDLSVDPVGEFSKLYLDLDLEMTSRARRFVERSSSPSNPVEAPPGMLHELRRDSRRNITVWKHRLTTDQVNRIRRLTAEISEQFYEPVSWG